MGDEDRGHELPQRVLGAPRASPLPAGSPAEPLLSVELRQRLEAAVTAERSKAAVREQDRPAGGEVTTPSIRTGISLDQPGHAAEPGRAAEPAEPGRAAEPARAAEPGRAARPARTPNAGPVAEDEVTEWLGRAEPRPATAGPDQPGPAGWVGAGIAALIVIPALVIGSLGVVAVRHLTGPSASSTASARQEAALRGEAAAWIAQQVAPGVAVSCDQVMCAALEARGLPARDLLVLGSLSPDPRHTQIVVETAVVRTLFGTSLDLAWAPAVLASFGSGPAGVTVRVVASHGAVAYQTALASDVAAGKAAGARLLADPRISVAATARAQLTAGLVDLRLLSALTALSGHLPVSLAGFGNVGPGAGAGVPLRYADLSQASQAAGLTQAAYVRSVRTYLSGFDTRFRPVRMVPVVLPHSQAVLRVEFTAPSPLGESGTPGSS
jgi:hypothetical protein